jgi:hypothetical protein
MIYDDAWVLPYSLISLFPCCFVDNVDLRPPVLSDQVVWLGQLPVIQGEEEQCEKKKVKGGQFKLRER